MLTPKSETSKQMKQQIEKNILTLLRESFLKGYVSITSRDPKG